MSSGEISRFFGAECPQGYFIEFGGSANQFPPCGSSPGPSTLVIAVAATPTVSGVPSGTLVVPQGGDAAFAVSTTVYITLGYPESIKVSGNTNQNGAPGVSSISGVTITVCQTDPSTAACMAPPAPSVTLNMSSGDMPTFSFFVNATGPIAASSTNKVYVEFQNESNNNVYVGGTAVLVQTENSTNPPPPTVNFQVTPNPRTANQPYTNSWQTTNATSLTYDCTSSGTGFAGSGSVNSPISGGSSSGIAPASAVGFPSYCTFTATGPGGNASTSLTVTTNP